MTGKKPSSLDRVLGRLDALDSIGLSNLVQRLARERAVFEEIFNSLHEGILVISASGNIEYANAAAHRLIGVGEEELAGQTLWRLVPGLHPTLTTALDDPDAAALPAIAREFELTYPEPRTLRLNLVPFHRDRRGDTLRFLVILSDVTREKKSTEQRIEDERTTSVLLLAAGVAHELGNPLNSLTIHLQLLERRLNKLGNGREVEALSESVAVCRDEVRRLDGIIRNFLDAIRPQAPDLAEIRPADVLGEVLRFQEGEFSDRGILVDAETPDNLPTIMADRNQLKQVFFNLCKNAIEAMQPGGRLRIRSRADDDFVYIIIADTGAGIRQEDLLRLFEPYRTSKPGGHGLGLMIVQRIMRAHGGQIGIESKEGVGTVVTLQFPRKDRRIRMLAS